MRIRWIVAVTYLSQAGAVALPYGPPTLTQRDSGNPGISANNDALVKAIKAANLDSWVPSSNNQIHEWTALGNSFTAGIGSNGQNDLIDGKGTCSRYKSAYPVQMSIDGRWGDSVGRTFNFGACSGDVMDDVLVKQLTQQPGKDYHNFVKPQVAVMTIGGNDLKFTEIINACVIRAFGYPFIPDCDTVLKKTEKQISSMEFLEKLDNTIIEIIKFGRSAGGASPANSFQLYILGYVPFWNQDDPGCDEVSFEFFSSTKDHLLTRDLRRQMNDLVNIYNVELKRAAYRLAEYGVIYVEGFQDSYKGHQFCEPNGDKLESPISSDTWFWHKHSPWGDDDGPEKGDPTTQAAQNSSNDLGLSILTYLVPDESNRTKILNGDDPSKYSDAFKSELNFNVAIGGLPRFIPEMWKRIFHPKRVGYWHQADVTMNTIIVDTEQKAVQAPVSTPQIGDTCGAWYKVDYDSFEIYGKNFDQSKLGNNGEGLLADLRHCGAVSDWSFTTRTNDPQGYQWFASGKLPIGTKPCIGSAVVSAGGSSPDGCTGAG